MTMIVYDCGCVESRPRVITCKSFGTRWRAYTSEQHVILKCRDCGRMQHFELRRPGVQVTMFGNQEPETIEEKFGIVEEVLKATKEQQAKILEELNKIGKK